MANPIAAVILAGGRSKRMGGGPPKPLRLVGGRTLLSRVAAALTKAGMAGERRAVVISPGFDKGAAGLEPDFQNWVVQPEAKGTGDAARWGLEALGSLGDPLTVVALADVPFTQASSYARLVGETPPEGLAFVSAELGDPGSLGRVVRNASGGVEDIVEFKELAPDQAGIREINAGHFCGRRSLLLHLLSKIKPGAKGGELYLTSIVAEARREGRPVAAVRVSDEVEALGANTPEELEALARRAGPERK